MALALAASYQLKSSAQGTTPLVTPSFTPANGEVITVTWETFDPAIVLTITNSGSQSITSRVLEQPGGFNGSCGVYAGTVSGSPGSMTITGTPGASARYSMTVERWSGAQLAATPVTNGNTATSGAAQSTLTPTGGAGGVIVWAAQDSQSVDPSTRAYAGSGTDDGLRDDHVGSNAVGYHGYQTITGNTSQTYGLTLPTGQKWVIAGLEVQPAAGATLTYPLQNPRRRRTQTPPRRARATTPVRAQVNPPFVLAQGKQPRIRRGLLPRRGHASSPVPPQAVVVAPAYPRQAVRSRIRGVRLFRSRAATPVPGQATPPVIQRPRIKLFRLSRGRAITPAPPQAVVLAPGYPPQSVRARLRGVRLFRGKSSGVVPAQVTVLAPNYPPQSVRARLRGIRLPRGKSPGVVPPQIAPPVTPAYPTQAVRARGRWLRVVRRGVNAPPLDQQTPPPSGIVRRRPQPSGRRNHAFTPPAPQTAPIAPGYPPQSVRSRLRGLKLFRPRTAVPVPPQVAVIAPKYPLPAVRARLKGLKLFRGRSATPVRQQEVNPPPPPPPPTPPQTGSWWGLVSVLREERAILAQAATYQVQACPNDGEPLRTSITGIRYCPYDLWRPEGQVPIPRTGTGQDWGGLAGVLAGARADHQQDKAYGWISCPNDGEPLSRSLNGTIYCKYDLWMPPDQPSPDFPLNS